MLCARDMPALRRKSTTILLVQSYAGQLHITLAHPRLYTSDDLCDFPALISIGNLVDTVTRTHVPPHISIPSLIEYSIYQPLTRSFRSPHISN
jgi:hypothetical protein